MQEPFYKWRWYRPDWPCPYYNADYYCCDKFDRKRCEPFSMEEIKQFAQVGFNRIDASKVCNSQLKFGNYYYYISKDDIKALQAGQVLFGQTNNEYGIFIVFRQDDE